LEDFLHFRISRRAGLQYCAAVVVECRIRCCANNQQNIKNKSIIIISNSILPNNPRSFWAILHTR
jgi:hypothetical protein